MATRALIGIQLEDESILGVYHHWDGYPQWLGKVLMEQYNTKEKVSKLIDGGNMSSCWSNEIWGEKLPEGQFAPEYYTARGESLEDNAPTLYKDLNKMCVDADNNYGVEYVYHFVDGAWKCHELNYSPDPNMIREVEIAK